MFYSVWPLWASFDSTYTIESKDKFLIWDIIFVNEDLFLVIDNKASWKEIHWEIKLYGNLFTPTTIFFQKFISKYWYSWYFKFFKLYIPDIKYVLRYDLPLLKRHKFDLEWEYIFKYENFDKYCNYLKLWDDSIKCLDVKEFSPNLLSSKQNLIVFPDDWSLFNFYEKYKIWEVLDINSTSLTRYKMFLKVKMGKVKTLITTHGGVFQDWKNLEKIFVFYPYKWYYKNQQNPRYYLPELSKQIKFFYNVNDLYFLM